MLETLIGKNVLITASEWFYAPDGNTYKAVWGELKSITKVDELLGFAPNRPNVNWVFEVGNMVIYGCQVKYIIRSDAKPKLEGALTWTSDAANGLKTFQAPNAIWVSE